MAVLAIAWPVFTGQFAQSRLTSIGQDFAIRYRHWQNALALRPAGWTITLFGTGLGRFPESDYLFADDASRPASYQFRQDGGNTYLRLRSGSPLYFEQLLPLRPGLSYRLAFDARSEQHDAALTVPICEKWLLTSIHCSWNSTRINQDLPTANSGNGDWKHFERTISTQGLRISPWYAQRPIKLALYSGIRDAVIDVDNVSLVRLDDPGAENLIRNGDFSAALDHWFFTEESHLPWHIHSLPVSVFFDQGWLGILAFGLLALYALSQAAARAWRGDLDAAANLGALSAFLIVGLLDTLIDAPRFLMLLLLIVLCSSLTIPVSNPRHSPKD